VKKEGITRRAFLAGAGAAGGMIIIGEQLDLLRSRAASAARRGEQVRVGMVGLGRQGQLLLRAFMAVPSVEIAALCDVDQAALKKAYSHVAESRATRLPTLFSDVRRVLDDRDVDVISIATPNHWHSLMGIWACQAGKDCFIESPCSHSFFEGRQLVAAAQKYGRIMQYGSLGQISDLAGFDPVELACIGEIQKIRTVCFSDKASAETTPPRFRKPRDFDLWAGPARVELPERAQLDWRKLPPMNNGDLGFFALNELHRNLQLLGCSLPSKVSTLSTGRHANLMSGERVAVQMQFNGDAQGVTSGWLDLEMLPMSDVPREVARLAAAKARGVEGKEDQALSVISETTVRGSGGTLTAISLPQTARETEYLVQNFIAAVLERDRQMLASPVSQAHVSCGSLHLANISLALKRSVAFDPETQSSIGDPQVNELLLGSHRAPYTVPARV
jgi:hypothetical protein